MRTFALLLVSLLAGCRAAPGDGEASTGTTGAVVAPTSGTDGDTTAPPDTSSGSSSGDATVCPADDLLDVLFVIDNTGEMEAEQVGLLAAMPHLVERLRGLGRDVNVMFTTTDVGHPLCSAQQPPGYYPARGEPTTTACTDRLHHFYSVGGEATAPEVCTDVCPADQVATADDPFVHFAGAAHNVRAPAGAADPVGAALACIGAQGFSGCGVESPLEAMLLALDRGKPWNRGDRPFLRECAALAIVVVSTETDCSVADDGHRFFDPLAADDPAHNLYWPDVSALPGYKPWPTSAVCWRAGMRCEGGVDGVYTSCTPEDRGVLHPLARYVDLLRDTAGDHRRVFMLALTGVPARPLGLPDLVHHDWTAADLPPGAAVSAEALQFSYGIGPGCAAPATGFALPPGRISAVCQALDGLADGERRCCVESVCSDEYTGAFDCLVDMLE